jgi:hypothetical protein
MSSISERAAAGIRQIPDRDRPISEQYRIVAKEWVELDGAARMLEGCKDITLSQMMNKLGDVPVTRAERDVKGSDGWQEYIAKMIEARTQANLKKAQLRYLEMRFSEWQATDATARAEMRMTRS